MTFVVGVAPDARSRAVVHLAGMLARSTGDDVVLCAVVPPSWPPSPAKIDAEYRAHLTQVASEALEDARRRLPADVSSAALVHHARSAAAGLLEVAEQHDAGLIVVASSPSGAFGRVTLGSAGGRLLHSSHVPVALATRGFRCKPGQRVTRATAAFGGTEGSDALIVAAAGMAARVGVSLRIAAFAVQPPPPYTSGVGREAVGSLASQWADTVRAAARAALDQVKGLPLVPPELEVVVGCGETWDEALEDVEWDDGDVLVVGSSPAGLMDRVFLGSHAAKIVRYSPVAVIVVPRGAVGELAERAERAAT